MPAHELDEPLELRELRQQERLGARVAQVGALLHATPVGHLLAEGGGHMALAPALAHQLEQ